jgi:hypothetical protein
MNFWFFGTGRKILFRCYFWDCFEKFQSHVFWLVMEQGGKRIEDPNRISPQFLTPSPSKEWTEKKVKNYLYLFCFISILKCNSKNLKSYWFSLGFFSCFSLQADKKSVSKLQHRTPDVSHVGKTVFSPVSYSPV